MFQKQDIQPVLDEVKEPGSFDAIEATARQLLELSYLEGKGIGGSSMSKEMREYVVDESRERIDIHMRVMKELFRQARTAGVADVMNNLQETDVDPWVLERAADAAR